MLNAIIIMFISLFLLLTIKDFSKITFLICMSLSPAIILLSSGKLDSAGMYFLFFIYVVCSIHVAIFTALLSRGKG